MAIMEHQAISEFAREMIIESYYILMSVSRRTTQTGKPYLVGVLRDAGGCIPFVMWDNAPNLTDDDVGKIVYANGEVQEYRNALQAKLLLLRIAGDNEADRFCLSDLIPYAPIDLKATASDMKKMLVTIEDSFYHRLAIIAWRMLEARLLVIPAAKSIHHAFVGGWLMHTWNMMRMAEQVVQQYGEQMTIDRDLLIAGTFLHDIGKIREFLLTDQKLVKDYSVEGSLLGHPMLGVVMLEDLVNDFFKAPDYDKLRQLEHILISHHGSPECGAAVYPQTVEAQIVHNLDGLDSRVEIFREEMGKTPEGSFSGFNRALQHRVYNNRTAS